MSFLKIGGWKTWKNLRLKLCVFKNQSPCMQFEKVNMQFYQMLSRVFKIVLKLYILKSLFFKSHVLKNKRD
jgi:hypothetical protein